ncbi:uncharacterized protein [Lepeophtheirus salmonis]|uniref:uncharacterized protein isoform X1 n=1 Tax=Lepeophtheirus salmonis TaxID=72036 RepID=UPI001AE12022|nr:uncharacterized protein LOC121114337 isoform X1 [Lepeophtheirus salmonis]
MHPYEYLQSLPGTADSSFSEICEPIDLSMKRDRSKSNQVESNSIACSVSSDESDRLVIDSGSSAEEHSTKKLRPSSNGCLESHSSFTNMESKNSIGKTENSERNTMRCNRSPNRKKVKVNIKYANRDYYERKRIQKTITEMTAKKTQRGSLTLKTSKRRKKRSSSHQQGDTIL